DEPLDSEVGYRVSFDRSGAGPWSLNNLRGTRSLPGYRGQAAPPRSALVFAQGRAQHRTCTLQAVLQTSAYPYALAATGRVVASGPLMVGGVSDLSDLDAGATEAGHVYAGSALADALTAGALSQVTGEARTPGGARFGAGSTVLEGISTGVPPESLPDVELSRYNNAGFDDVTVLTPGNSYSLLTGPVYVNGDITLTAAVLDNAYLYVDGGGNLDSLLSLSGTGTLLVTGRTRITGALTLVVSQGIAVFSQGDLEVQGGNVFQGVLYSHGDIHVASGLNVVGSVVSHGGSVRLDGLTSVVHYPGFTRFGGEYGTNMLGSVLNEGRPPIEVVFWREVP
ncbi:MAG: hypothetical protein AB1758_12415, partial [Candidatus Eremiobacterota bacterium]